jgi:hypothetical protein
MRLGIWAQPALLHRGYGERREGAGGLGIDLISVSDIACETRMKDFWRGHARGFIGLAEQSKPFTMMMTPAPTLLRMWSQSIGILLVILAFVVGACMARAEKPEIAVKVADGSKWQCEVVIKNTTQQPVKIDVLYPLDGKGLPTITPGVVVFEELVDGRWEPIVIYHDVVGTGETLAVPGRESKRAVLSVRWLENRVRFPATVRGTIAELGIITDSFVVSKDGRISAVKE